MTDGGLPNLMSPFSVAVLLIWSNTATPENSYTLEPEHQSD